MAKQFSNISSQYGAPMGRTEHHSALPEQPAPTIRLYRVRLNSGGYDDDGAYWGVGVPLYCAEDTKTDYRQFVRAVSRLDAAIKLRLIGRLLRPVAGADPNTAAGFRTSRELRDALRGARHGAR